jgi:hypothetical protein
MSKTQHSTFNGVESSTLNNTESSTFNIVDENFVTTTKPDTHSSFDVT